jgi:ParB-like chromosome segregation protein Spo0J
MQPKQKKQANLVKPGGVGELSPDQIKADPKRFQYKILGEKTKTGEVGSLAGVKRYDPNLAGLVQVWRDPKDGETYVVNGHNRLALAKRLGADSVAVRYLDVPNAQTARAVGALTNIAEGRGTAMDAAKFFKDSGMTRSDLESKGIPMREITANKGIAISKLDDSLFQKAINGELSENRAAIIGGAGLQHSQQRDLAKLIDRDGKRRRLTDEAIQELADTARSSSVQTQKTMSLFGEEDVKKSNLIERAQLQASIKKRLSREKKLFATVSNANAAQDLQRAGNRINTTSSAAISDRASQALGKFDILKNYTGPISSILNEGASRVASGEKPSTVEKEIYSRILDEIKAI